MFCQKCGFEIQNGMKYCPKCGSKTYDKKMLCKNCGLDLSGLDGVEFCPSCGKKMNMDVEIVDKPITDVDSPKSNNINEKQKKIKHPFVIWGLLFFFVICALALTVLYSIKFSPKARLQEQLELGSVCLSELNYQEAVDAFNRAIEIDSQNTDAYDGLIDAYIALDDSDGLLSINDLAHDNLSQSEAERIAEIIEEATRVYSINTDGYVVFGSYEQDNNISNGAEPIEWVILKEDEDGLLLISRYILDLRPINSEYMYTTWASCDLRKWLNGSFYDTAFSDKEKEIIEISNLTTQGNPNNNSNGGPPTDDKVYILSIEEIESLPYFDSDLTVYGNWTYAEPTEYLLSKVNINDYYGSAYEGERSLTITSEEYYEDWDGWSLADVWDPITIGLYRISWWTRTPSWDNDCFSDADFGASFDRGAVSVTGNEGVRPVIYITK